MQRVKYISRGHKPSQTVALNETVPPESFTQFLFRSIGFQRIAQDEYLHRLRRERDVYLARIAELQKQIEEEERRDP